jgi:alpha-amylase
MKSSTTLLCRIVVFLFFLLSGNFIFSQNPWNGKVVLQGFWWDYWNTNYQNGWANYVADLSPRLRDLGIDGVWVPPSIKNAGPGSNGYSPFDQYDLGDKYQKGNLKTRLGNKNELLRMIGVLHANGMDVIQDVVFNHLDNAGSADGSGGTDPLATSNNDGNLYKNFRYVSYSTPASSETSVNYLARSGRWPKNWPNFHSNSGHVCNSGDWCAASFGPDVCYYSGAYGQSSNATYNPVQAADHMRINARNWLVWMKKQTGVDGFRFDAVKHFPHWAMQDFLWNVKYSASWANGGANMFAVGEYVGNGGQLDTWINDVRYSNGGTEDMVGTFDFSLRQEIKNMVSGGGGYNLGSIPGSQQTNRYRTVPFVNNHDTFRPLKDSVGNYIGWDSGNELGGGHIDPFDARLAVSYAVAFSVDGSPQVFFEDLFNIGNTGKRYSHQPTNATDLPVRDDIANIIWCHQKLNFKKGSYKVRAQGQDLLIVERGYNAGPENSYAIIGMNDNWNTWQSANIQTDFGPNRQLHDYSGANASDIWTDATGRATIWIPPCDGSNLRRGYCIWGPTGIAGGFNPAQRSTTQEWEMANDLGDSHASSLQQGGALPASSAALRTVGKIFNEGNKLITVNLYPTNNTKNLTVNLYNSGGSIIQTVAGTGNLTLTHTPASTGFYTVKVKNTSTSNPAQNVFVKVTYTSPKIASTSVYPARVVAGASPSQVYFDELPMDETFTNYPDPVVSSTNILFTVNKTGRTSLILYNMQGVMVKKIIDKELIAGAHKTTLNKDALAPGVYLLRLTSADEMKYKKIVIAQ